MVDEKDPEDVEFYWTTNEERFSSGPFDSRQAAVDDALGEVPGETFWTGWKYQPTGDDFGICAENILEQIGVDAYDMAGECAEDWPANYGSGDDDVEELETKLNAILHAWLDKHDPPSFWIARGIQEHPHG